MLSCKVESLTALFQLCFNKSLREMMKTHQGTRELTECPSMGSV